MKLFNVWFIAPALILLAGCSSVQRSTPIQV